MQALSGLCPLMSLTITVQAPQSPSLQPSFVPVRCRVSRNQSNKVVVGDGSVKVTDVPLRRNETYMGKPAAVLLVSVQPPFDAA